MEQAQENRLSIFVKVFKTKKACHCNKVFLRRAKLILALSLLVFESIYKSYFTFRQTGTHPPFSF